MACLLFLPTLFTFLLFPYGLVDVTRFILQGYLYCVTALNTLNRLNKEGEALALEDDLTTHPTLALMRRILADAQVSSSTTFRIP